MLNKKKKQIFYFAASKWNDFIKEVGSADCKRLQQQLLNKRKLFWQKKQQKTLKVVQCPKNTGIFMELSKKKHFKLLGQMTSKRENNVQQ